MAGCWLLVLLCAVGSTYGRVTPSKYPQSHPQLQRREEKRNGERNLTTHPDTRNCTVKWFNQTVDHFQFQGANPATYLQRYFVCDQFWDKANNGPIFFYTGNEAPVDLFVNHTGLMWENAAAFGALLLFAEHRYYGESQPSGTTLQYLTHEQAMADYAKLLYEFKLANNALDSAVIAFGGSYGGMLAAWMRLKYPASIDGSIAASAPILMFQGTVPPYDTNSYWQVVTRDATPAAGAAAACSTNVRSAWGALTAQGSTADGRAALSRLFSLCEPLANEYDVFRLALFMYFAWDTMAMGNYPYPSNYLTGGGPELPGFPMREACQFLNDSNLQNDTWRLLAAARDATSVYNNATHSVKCYDLPDDIEEDGIWDYQFCTEMLPQESYFTTDGVHDMFWNKPFNFTFILERCSSKFGVTPRPFWIYESYGGLDLGKYGSNIVFSNGLYDPWSSGGVMQTLSPSLPAVIIEDGAHHLDLFFSNPLDPSDVVKARQIEVANIKNWVAQKRKQPHHQY